MSTSTVRLWEVLSARRTSAAVTLHPHLLARARSLSWSTVNVSGTNLILLEKYLYILAF